MRRVLVLVAVVVIALGAWWLWHDDAARVDSTPAPNLVAAPDPPQKRLGRPRARAEPTPVEATKETPPPPSPAHPVEKVTDAEAGHELLVVDAITGAPAPGVTVSLLVVGTDPITALQGELREAFEKASDPIDVVVERGRSFVSDAQGRVVLPKFSGMAIVAADQDDLRGIQGVQADGNEWRLELHRRVGLTALVVDAAGRPCRDVRVLLLHKAEFGTYPEGEATSGASDGIARFTDVAQGASNDDKGVRALAVALPLADGPNVSFDLAKPPADPVRLVLPPCGRVRCEVTDSGGAPAPDGQLVLLRRVREAPRGSWVQDGPGQFDDARATTSGGAALFPLVGVGLELEVEVASADKSTVSVRKKFAGPNTAADEAVVRVTLGGRRPAAVGRLVDAKGAPAAGVEIFAGIVEPGHSETHGFGNDDSVTTGADGRFRFVFDRPPGDAGSAKLQIGRRVMSAANAWSTRRIALVDLPSVLPSGDVDVGDVTYRGTELLVSGVIVDAAGKPLAGAVVVAMSASRDSPMRDVDAVWADAEGRFRIEGDPSSASRVAVGVDLAGYYVGERASFAAGATDARVEMQAAGGIAGSLRIPEGVPAYEVRVLVSGEPANNGDAGYRLGGGLEISLESGGTFECRSLRPGRARVQIRLGWNDDDTILTVEDVLVEAGKVTRDARLQDVDASKSLSGIDVLVTDAEKKPVEGALVHFRPIGSDQFWKQAAPTGPDGTTRVQSKSGGAARGGLDIVVTCSGYRSADLHSVTANATVALASANPTIVTVRLASGSPLPEPPFQLAASLQWIEPGASDDDSNFGSPRDIGRHQGHDDKFGKDRVVKFETWDAGRYRVELMLWEMDMSGGGGGGIDSDPRTVTVTVGGDGAPVEVVVGVNAEDLKQRTDRKR